VVVGIGGVNMVAGLLMLVTFGFNEAWDGGNELQRDFGGIFIGAGAGVALLIGTPITVVGATKAPRAMPAALGFAIAF